MAAGAGSCPRSMIGLSLGRGELYEQAQGQEYLAVLLEEQEIRWHVLVDGSYQRMDQPTDGIWRSRLFGGLWLNGPALLAGKLAEVFATLNEGLQSDEHQQFVAELESRRPK